MSQKFAQCHLCVDVLNGCILQYKEKVACFCLGFGAYRSCYARPRFRLAWCNIAQTRRYGSVRRHAWLLLCVFGEAVEVVCTRGAQRVKLKRRRVQIYPGNPWW
ncbi:hypothetical protein HBI81_243520 [Parastagonospora nodorum]|nr:hypothetical protein HBI81_243520 [Parastagonospora nodorum]